MNIFPEEYVTDSFKKKVFWVKETQPDNADYPQTFELQCTQSNTALLDNYRIHDVVECKIDLRGKHYVKNGKEGVINAMQVWSIKNLGQQQQPQRSQPAQQQRPVQTTPQNYTASNIQQSDIANDDLPF